MKKEKEIYLTPHVASCATYAPARVGTQRYSRAELAGLRKGVMRLFDGPSDTVLANLVRAFERIQGGVAHPHQVGYLIHCYRVHGPATEALLLRVYRERGPTTNLLLAVELTRPNFLPERVDDAEMGSGVAGSVGGPVVRAGPKPLSMTVVAESTVPAERVP